MGLQTAAVLVAAASLLAASEPAAPNQAACLKATAFAAAVPQHLVYHSDYGSMAGSTEVKWLPLGDSALSYVNDVLLEDGFLFSSQRVVFERRSLRTQSASLHTGPDLQDRIYALYRQGDTVRGDFVRSAGGVTDVGETIDAAMLLPGAFRALIPALDLEKCPEGAFESYTLDGPSRATYRVMGPTTETVPAGTFDAWSVHVTYASGSVTLTVRREFPHFMLREPVPGVAAENVLAVIREFPISTK